MIYNARELPLFSNRDDPNIYLPISVISVPFEWIVYDQLHSYLELHDIIYKYKIGFDTIHSTVTVLFVATDTWGSQC